MTGDAPVTDKATERPWCLGESEGNKHRIYAEFSDHPSYFAEVARAAFWTGRSYQEQCAIAALIVTAVNSYDESRALLKEAEDKIFYACEFAEEQGYPETANDFAELATRIRAHLGE